MVLKKPLAIYVGKQKELASGDTLAVGDVTVSSGTSEAVNANSLKAYAPAAKLLPLGGTTGQVPKKNSATDGDISWVTLGLANMNVVFANGTGGTVLATSATVIGTVTITPQASTSTVFVFARVIFTKDTGTTRRTVQTRLLRNSTTVIGDYCDSPHSQNVASTKFGPNIHLAGDNSHGTTSAITYTLYGLADVDSGAISGRWEMGAVELLS